MRITDTERGARMALEAAGAIVVQGDLFNDDFDLWASIYLAALEAEAEERLCRQAMA